MLGILPALISSLREVEAASTPPFLLQAGAPTAVIISGPIQGSINVSYTFTATVTPESATTPITYDWTVIRGDGTPEYVTHSGGLTDELSFTWTAGGFRSVSVTASSSGGSANGYHLISIEVPAFLYPPYPNSSGVISVFDHSTPQYDADPDDDLLTWQGERRTNLNYDGHAGLDYDVNYFPVFSAGDSDQVIYSGWFTPMDHRAGLGLYVRLHHLYGYETLYGHLSANAVGTCAMPGCVDLSHGDVIGISGDTGDSEGPHLHFEVRTPSNYPVDPYGYNPLPESEEQTPVWKHTQPNSLWEIIPDVSIWPSILPTGVGNALPLTAGPRGGVLVDDYAHLPANSAPNFETEPVEGCWNRSGIKEPEDAENRYNLYTSAVIGDEDDEGTCFARWYLPTSQPSGEYAVYLHIPRVSTNPLADSTVYRVFGAGMEMARLVISQFEINSRILGSQMGSEDLVVETGWIYIGSYGFEQGAENYIELSNTVIGQTYDNNGNPASLDEDTVAVIDFDYHVRVASPLQRLPEYKDSLLAAIDTIDSSGGTNIGIGVQMGCDVLKQSDYPLVNKGAILLTDGVGAFSGQDQCFVEQGWPIYTFGFGDSDDALLQQIAFNTGGEFKHIDDLTFLICEFVRVRALIAGVSPGPCIPLNVPYLDMITFSELVPANQAQATFSTSWPGSDVVMTLTSPSGRVIDRSTAAPDVAHDVGPGFETYSIRDPEAGEWQISLFGADVPPEGEEVIFGFTTVPAQSEELIFADGFESGDLSAWSSPETDNGDLSVTTQAALTGTYGMQALIDDDNNIHVQDDTPSGENLYRARFSFDPHSISMASGDSHAIFTVYAPQGQYLLSAAKIAFGFNGSNYRVQAGVLCDVGYFCYVTPLVTISDAPHTIEIEWWAASGPGAEDAGLRLWVDGEQQAEITGVDNDTQLIERVQLGATAGIEATTNGVEYFDDFASYRGSSVQSAGGGSQSGAFAVEGAGAVETYIMEELRTVDRIRIKGGRGG